MMTQTDQGKRELSMLLAGISPYSESTQLQVTGLCLDSRQVQPGDCFFAYPGVKVDGRQFIKQALAAGATVVLYEPHPDIQPTENCLPIINLQHHIGVIASRYWDNIIDKLTIIGVTGTNGKSTCCYWLCHCLAKAGFSSAMIGTIGVGPIDQLSTSSLTTPDPVALHRLLATFAQSGITHVAMEVSSHSLVQRRVDGIPFAFAAFTNLTHEHLDYHGTMRDYANAKARLFSFESLHGAVLNIDDNVGWSWLNNWATAYPLTCISRTQQRDCPPQHSHIQLSELKSIGGDSQFQVDGIEGKQLWQIPAWGAFNIDNAATVAALCHLMKIDTATIADALATLPTAPGRMQIIQTKHKPTCVVDFAHTPDALQSVLVSLRKHCQGQLWCVFGCGGERDQAKRPLMGEMAVTHADHCIITDDNPRSEDPQKISDDIRAGIPNQYGVRYIANRDEAIQTAINACCENDVILVAGKGHETKQIIGSQILPFDDAEVIHAWLNRSKHD